MRKLAIGSTALLLAFGAAAADYPNARVIGTTDKLTYAVGEHVRLSLQIVNDTQIAAGTYYIRWQTWGDDHVGGTDAEPHSGYLGPVFGTNVAYAVDAGTLQTNGWKYVSAKLVKGNASNVNQGSDAWIFDGGAVFARGDIAGTVPAPSDIAAVWDQIKADLAAVPIEETRYGGRGDLVGPSASNFLVSVSCPGGRPMTGSLTLPYSGKGEKFRALIAFDGYNDKPQVPAYSYDTANQTGDRHIFLRINAHGWDLWNAAAQKEYAANDPYYDTFKSQYLDTVSGGKTYQYLFDPTLSQTATDCYFRGMVCRVIRAVQYVKSLPEWNGTDIEVTGASQAGLQSIWAAACGEGVTKCSVSVPWGCDILGKATDVRHHDSWYLPNCPGFGYYDAVNVAPWIPATCTVDITKSGLGDTCCPPSGVTALYNAMTCPKSITYVQGGTHGYSPPLAYRQTETFSVGTSAGSGTGGGADDPAAPAGGATGCDLTAAVREAGLTPSVSASCGSAVSPVETLFDGRISGYQDALTQRWVAQGELPVSIDYAFPEAFHAGEGIVVTACTFAIGAHWYSGYEWSGVFGNYDRRVPRNWTLQGSNDGTRWSDIVSLTGCDAYTTLYHDDLSGDSHVDGCTGTFSFANANPFRKYRLTVTTVAASSDESLHTLQLSEIALSGFFGSAGEDPDPGVGTGGDPDLVSGGGSDPVAPSGPEIAADAIDPASDLTALVRAARLTPAVGLSLPPYDNTMTKDNLFDGDPSSRYLSLSALTSGTTLSYGFPSDFSNGCDIVVTGYRLHTRQYAQMFDRLPRSWTLEGSNDGANWTALDAQTDFTVKNAKDRYGAYGWIETTSAETGNPYGYSAEIRFNNARAFRSYRFTISGVQTAGAQLQMCEVSLLGYVGQGLAGRVPRTFFGYPMEITKAVRAALNEGRCSAPVISCDATLADKTAETEDATFLFSGLASNKMQNRRFITKPGETGYPVNVDYAVPPDFFAGDDIVLSNYTVAVLCRYAEGYPAGIWGNSTPGNSMAERMPKSWALQGSNDGVTWKTLDSRKDFTSWTEEHDNGETYVTAYRGSFGIAKTKGFRRYRLSVREVNGGNSLQLSEITFSGRVGCDILPPPPGLAILVK